MVRKRVLHPGAPVYLGLDTLGPRLERTRVGEHQGHVGASGFGQQRQQRRGNGIARDPVCLGGRQAREVFGEPGPGEDARRLRQGDGRRRRVEVRQLRQLAKHTKVRGARPCAHEERVLRKVCFKRCQEALVALLDHVGGGGVGADEMQPADLPA